MSDAAPAARHNVLGLGVHALEGQQTTELVIEAATKGRPLGVAFLNVHGTTLAVRDPDLRCRLNDLELLVPDGQPIRWALNWLHSVSLEERVYGPDLMMSTCRRAAAEGLPVFFYGGHLETLDLLGERLVAELPDLQIVGMQPGRYRQASEEEHLADVSRIRDSGAAMVFVGLGCPRQEIWVYENREELSMPVLGVGAAFDYHSGQMDWPPAWMQRHGLEWLYRLWQEPRRLWRRYLIPNPLFLMLLMVQMLHLRRFEIPATPDTPPLVRPS
jgi:exopolysaccharide biosynthesis WecB/TagA/CpsF family protein